MPNPSRDEIAMAVVRAIYGAEGRVKRGELVPPKNDADETRLDAWMATTPDQPTEGDPNE